MYLIDTNIFLELLLDRKNSESCRRFLEKVESEKAVAVVTTFSLHTVAIIMENLKSLDDYKTFLETLMGMKGLLLYSTVPSEELEICDISGKKKLDFDDSLHYFVAKKMNLKLVSFDRHFDGTGIERLEPKDVL